MSSFLRWPRRYRVVVRGFNFREKLSDEPKAVCSFHTNRWVNAFDTEEAVAKAFGSVRDQLREQKFDSIANVADLKAAEIEEVSLWTKRWSKTPEIIFEHEEKDLSEGSPTELK